MLLNRVRSSIKSVVSCDVLQTEPLLGNSNVESLFDVIISIFCLECAVASPLAYPDVVANVAKLLRPNGHLIMAVQYEVFVHLLSSSFFF